MRYSSILILVAVFGLISCSLQPAYDVASFTRLTPSVGVSRHRDLVISPLSHVGIYLDTQRIKAMESAKDNPLLAVRLEELNDGVNLAIFQQFNQVSRLDNARSVNRTIDFIIEAHVLQMTFTEKTIIEPPEPTVDMSYEEANQEPKVLIPTDYLDFKLLLKDARTNQVIDTALVTARSGQLTYQRGYSAFASHALEQYLKQITP